MGLVRRPLLAEWIIRLPRVEDGDQVALPAHEAIGPEADVQPIPGRDTHRRVSPGVFPYPHLPGIVDVSANVVLALAVEFPGRQSHLELPGRQEGWGATAIEALADRQDNLSFRIAGRPLGFEDLVFSLPKVPGRVNVVRAEFGHASGQEPSRHHQADCEIEAEGQSRYFRLVVPTAPQGTLVTDASQLIALDKERRAGKDEPVAREQRVDQGQGPVALFHQFIEVAVPLRVELLLQDVFRQSEDQEDDQKGARHVELQVDGQECRIGDETLVKEPRPHEASDREDDRIGQENRQKHYCRGQTMIGAIDLFTDKADKDQGNQEIG